MLRNETERFGTTREELAMLSVEELVDMIVELRSNLLVTEVMCDRLEEDNYKKQLEIAALGADVENLTKGKA